MVSFIESIGNGYKNMFVTDECATRAEYWWWIVYQWCVIGLLRVVFYFDDILLFTVLLGFVIAHILPNCTLIIRRLHDSDHSGWNMLWGLIPYLGILIHLYFMLLPSSPLSDWRDDDEYETSEE